MLQVIRDRLSGWVAGIIFGVIGLALVLTFGAMRGDVGMTANVVASVDGMDIGQTEFLRAVQDEQLRLREEFRGTLPDEFEEQIRALVLDDLINSTMMRAHAEERGFTTTDARVAGAIQSVPAFLDQGTFSRDLYRSALASIGQTPAYFEQQQRGLMTLQQFYRSIEESAFFTPVDFRFYIELVQESRSVRGLFVSTEPFRDATSVTDEQVAEYYAMNASGFWTRESVDIEYIEVNANQLPGLSEITEQDALEWYERNRDQFISPAQRRSSHILLEASPEGDQDVLARAEQVVTRLDAGEDFAALAAELSEDKGSALAGGDLGWIEPGGFEPEFEDALFALQEPGDYTAPVQSQFGYHIIRLDGVRGGDIAPFESAREDVLADLRERRSSERFFDLAEQLADLALESEDGLAWIASDLELPLNAIEGFTREGAGEFAKNQRVIEAAYSEEVLDFGENSRLIQLAPDRAIVLRVSRHQPSEQQPLEDVAERIREILIGDAAAAAASAQGAALLERRRGAEAFSALSAEQGVELFEDPELRRDSADYPPQLLNAIFAARPGDAPQGLALLDGRYALFEVEEVLPGQPERIAREQRDEVKAELEEREALLEYNAYRSGLRDRARVWIAPDALGESS
ncbi:SurA N-terminal domain-containing protein [Candidatus Foliamicus sp.]